MEDERALPPPEFEGEVKLKKKSFWKKLVTALLPDGETNAKDYIVDQVLIPGLWDLFWDGMDRFRYRKPGGKGRGWVDPTGQRHVPYSKASSDSVKQPKREKYLYDYEDISFSNAGDATFVLNEMRERLQRFGEVSVADMYDIAGKTVEYSSYTYKNYGWTSLTAARVVRLGVDYYLYLPKARSLV